MKKAPPRRSTSKRKTLTPANKAWLERYCRERDSFFVANPYARILIGVFLVSFALFIGVLYWAKMQTIIGMSIYERSTTYYHN